MRRLRVISQTRLRRAAMFIVVDDQLAAIIAVADQVKGESRAAGGVGRLRYRAPFCRRFRQRPLNLRQIKLARSSSLAE